MALTPPQAPPTWDHSAEDISKFTKESIEAYRKVMDKIGALDPKDATFESVSNHLINIFQAELSHSLFS
jgi:metallopeptidase MepB